MNDIDFIKWLTSYAEEFKYQGDGDPAPDIIEYNTYIMQADNKDLFSGKILYPLLLQRAIEGINKKSEDYIVIQNHRHTTVATRLDYDYLFEIEDISDQAKEEVLKYVWKTSLNDAKI